MRAVVLLITALVLSLGSWAQDLALPKDAPAEDPRPQAAGDSPRKPVAAAQASDAAGQTASRRTSSTPGSGPHIRLLHDFYADQKAVWTGPLRMRLDDITWLAPLAGLTAGALVSDAQFSRHLSNDPNRLKRARDISNLGVAGLVGVGGGLYAWGLLTHDDHKQETGWLMGEGMANTFALTSLAKLAFGRERPEQGTGAGRFRQGGSSFPSEHAALAWTAASILAHEYPGPLTQALAYGAAGAVSAARGVGKEHFASDVLLGSALGWFVGHEVYRLHHDREIGGAEWGQFVRDGEGQREARSMASPYVPTDSWVYGAFDRLSALGYAPSGFAGLRPWTRMECAGLVQEAQEQVGGDDESSDAAGLVDALAQEFRDDLELLGGGRNLAAGVDSVYLRWTGISGTPLRDSYHFSQTIINDFGRPYAEGNNYVTGFSSHAQAGPVAFFVQGEYQRAPQSSALPLSARQTIVQVDLLPATLLPPATPDPSVSRLRVINAYAALNLEGWQLSFGKQTLWWGPGRGGPMLLSNNADAINMFRISRPSPLRLPGLFKFLGTVRTEFFLGQLDGYHLIQGPSGIAGGLDRPLSRQPFVHGEKLSFKPTANFEFSVSRTTVFSGSVFPLTWGRFETSLLSTGNLVGGSENKPGDRRSALDLTYRIPKLRNWLTFYADGFADDEFSPIAYWDRSAWTAGLYLPQIPKLPKLDLRAEGVYTDLPIGGAVSHGFFYFNGTWRSGYTNDGNLLGSWIGREGQGAQAWSTYHFSPRSFVEANFRHQKVSHQFLPQGGSLTDVGARAEFAVRSDLEMSGGVQYERWNFPMVAQAPQRNVSTSLQLTWRPKLGLHSAP